MRETTAQLTTAFVPLAGLLKFASLVGSGGEAKHVIQAGHVRVNGAVEKRRGAKIRPGDVVVVEGEESVRIRVTTAEIA